MPGVSRNTNCAWGKFFTPRIRWRVVCGLGVTMASLVPMMALSSVDFPTFGAPMMVTKPARNDAVCIGATILQQLLFCDSVTIPHISRRPHHETFGSTLPHRGPYKLRRGFPVDAAAFSLASC